MSPEWPKLLQRLNSVAEEGLLRLVPSLIEEVQRLSDEQRTELVATALRNRVTDIEEIRRGNRARLALSVVLRATGVRTIRSAEEEAVWHEITEDLKGLNGDPEEYDRLNLRPVSGIADGTEAIESESGRGQPQ